VFYHFPTAAGMQDKAYFILFGINEALLKVKKAISELQ
jgi:hypothetical protein